MKFWKKLSQKEIGERIEQALDENINFYEENIIGVPGSHLDDKVFYQDAPFLNDAPFLSTLVHNPNHIGCHTLGESESFFKGTQEIERELLNICAVDILKGKEQGHDGYIASGGTEANLQALWIYRNFYFKKHKAKSDEIVVICSEDTHYSIFKVCNILQLDLKIIRVNKSTRNLSEKSLMGTLKKLKEQGYKFFFVVANMMTTMFGSVDDIDLYVKTLKHCDCDYLIHVDGAYGGFFLPFSHTDSKLSFQNSNITSFSLDAHKMVQAPYGTGIFLIRKGFMHYARTEQAQYVEGEDYTIIGSRSGANAVAVWMILMKNGPYEWKEKILILLNRANWMCSELKKLNFEFYRNRFSNIITIHSKYIKKSIAKKYGLVPDSHQSPQWYKVVIMDHVTIDKLLPFMNDIRK